MTTHISSAPAREETPHATPTTETADIINAMKKRAQMILDDPLSDPRDRALLRYALEVNDPWLARLGRQIESDLADSDELNAPQTFGSSEDHPSADKIEALVDLICRPGDEPETKSGALLVLLSTLEKSTEPTAIANAKRLAFAHYDDFTVDDMIDAQIATVEAELFAVNTPVS